MEGKTE